MRILIADDESKIRKIMNMYFSSLGHTIVEAEDGQEALMLYKDCDLLILDVMMPFVDGLEVCRQVKNKSPETKVIILTAKTSENDELDAFNAGADDYLRKPFSLGVLKARVENLLKNKQSKRSEKPKVRKNNSVRHKENYRKGLVKIDGKSIEFTHSEMIIWEDLIKDGQVSSREHLAELLWDGDKKELRQIDTFIKNIRKKIKDTSFEIKIRWGEGYYVIKKEKS